MWSRVIFQIGTGGMMGDAVITAVGAVLSPLSRTCMSDGPYPLIWHKRARIAAIAAAHRAQPPTRGTPWL